MFSSLQSFLELRLASKYLAEGDLDLTLYFSIAGLPGASFLT